MIEKRLFEILQDMTRKYQKEKYNNRYENEKKDKISEKAGGVKKEKLHIETKSNENEVRSIG